LDTMEITSQKKKRCKMTAEELYNVYLECNAPGAPVKMILQRYGLTPWDLSSIRKKVKEAAIDALSKPTKGGRKGQAVALEQYQKVSRELQETKDALATIGYELSLLKKRTD